MKTYRLIKTQDKFILVNYEEIQINDNYVAWETNYATEPKERWVIYNRVSGLNGTNQHKIIAGIPELPITDFSLLKEEDCKTIGYVDVEKWVSEHLEKNHIEASKNRVKVVSELFRQLLSLNDKMFSLEDMRKAILMGRIRVDNISPKYTINEIIQSLQQTSWDVEVEMEVFTETIGTSEFDFMEQDNTRPKITNGKIKITKIL